MKPIFLLSSCLIFLIMGCDSSPQNTSPSDFLSAQEPGEEGYRLVLDELVLDESLRMIGEEWNDVWIRDCEIRSAEEDGIFIRNVKNLRISGCEISEVRGQAGIRLSSTGGSEDVLIERNHIHDVDENGINASQRFEDDVHHERLRVVGNTIERTGQEGRGGLTHGLYIQSAGHFISQNIVRDAGDGNGISVRSSGVVTGNQVYGYAQSGIRYFSDHYAGDGNLLIENNMVFGAGTGAAIDALFSSSTDEDFRVGEIVTRFNTAVSQSAPAMAFDRRLAASTEWLIGGNLILAPTLVEGGEQGTNVEAAVEDFVSMADLHLVGPHSARGDVDQVSAPALDLDGEDRPLEGRDPGADHFEQPR